MNWTAFNINAPIFFRNKGSARCGISLQFFIKKRFRFNILISNKLQELCLFIADQKSQICWKICYSCLIFIFLGPTLLNTKRAKSIERKEPCP